jgi:hypothetical protein
MGSARSDSGAHLGPELFEAMAEVNIFRIHHSSAEAALNAIQGSTAGTPARG